MIKLARFVVFLSFCQFIRPVVAQSSLALSSITTSPGSAYSLSLTLASAGNQPAALQWTFSYPLGATGFSVSAGPALLAASKSINCAGNPSAYTCLASGLNSNIIANGVLGTISFSLAGTADSAPVTVAKAVGVSPTGSSVSVSTITPSIPTTLPSIPTNVTAAGASATAINIAWSASTDIVGVAGYKLYRGGSQIAVVTAGTNYQDTGLTPSTLYTYNVAAYDTAGNLSSQSAASTASTLKDTIPPSIPTSVTATAASPTAIYIAWSASTDNVGVVGYQVYRGATQIAVVTNGTSYQDTMLAPSTAYTYTVAAYDAAGNLSGRSAVATASTLKDTTPPSIPTNVTATAASATAIYIAWSASTDNVGVVGYQVYRGGTQIAVVTSGTSYQDTGLTPSTAYTYTVAAYDAAGNLSGQSAAVTASTSSSISRQQFKSASISYGRSVTISLPNATIPGNELVVAVSDYYANANDGAAFSIADSYQNTWRTAVDYQPGGRLIVYYAENIAGGANHQITIGATTATYYIATAVEYAGLAKTNSLDTLATNRAFSSSYTSTNGTTSHATELLFGLHHVWNTSTTFTPSLGWNQIQTTINAYHEHTTQDQIVASVGSYASTGMESPAAADTQSVMVTFSGAINAMPSTAIGTEALTLDNSARTQPLLLLHGDPSELSGTENGATVTPSSGPLGLTGAVIVNGAGSVNVAAQQSGDGIYFQKCCDNSSNAYYKFSGTPVGTIFDSNHGQISFYLKSRYTFAQRQASGSARFVFDVRDQDPDNHLYYFSTQATGGHLQFSYSVNNVPQFYYAPPGTEDTLFGLGNTVKVTISWDGSEIKLYLNDGLVQSAAYSKPNPNWTPASTFDIGAYEYLNLGGFNACDDMIYEFMVTAVPHR